MQRTSVTEQSRQLRFIQIATLCCLRDTPPWFSGRRRPFTPGKTPSCAKTGCKRPVSFGDDGATIVSPWIPCGVYVRAMFSAKTGRRRNGLACGVLVQAC